MATDLFGKPIGRQPEPQLSVQQRQQATLLYYWMSLDYLKGLKDLIDALIKGADVDLALARHQGRDAVLANARWGVRDTATNWSTYGFPALEDFKRSTAQLIAWRAAESYSGTGATQCDRLLQELSSLWRTPEEEERFQTQWQKVYRYAARIDDAVGIGNRRALDDYGMFCYGRPEADWLARLPRYRVRTDVTAVSGKRPVRTGVYVAQDDSYATLQFAWTGNPDGALGDAVSFNALGRRMISTVGWDKLWRDDQEMRSFALAELQGNPALDLGPYTEEDLREDPSMAAPGLAFAVFETRPCNWYFVERVEGEFDDGPEPSDQDESSSTSLRLRCLGGEACPQTGYWTTPADSSGRRRFALGEVMPAIQGDYGTTIWQWDEDQSSR